MSSRGLKIAFFVFVAVLPLMVRNQYVQHLLVMAGIFVLFSVGLNVIVGFLGQLSLGHSAYFGIGAYTYALLVVKGGIPFLPSMALAVLMSGLFGLLIGYPSLRLKGPYFAIVSLAFAMIIRLVVVNWQGLTNGPMGITGIKPPSILFFGDYEIGSALANYYLVLCAVILGIFSLHRIRLSRTGDAFDACRENEELSQAVGIDTSRYKIIALIISTMFIGAAGGLYAQYMTYISPELFGWYYIATPLIMVIIGGAGTVAGPVAGALIFTFLPEVLRAAADYRLALFGLIMVGGIIFMPNGIYGVWRNLIEAKTKSEHSYYR